MQCMMSAKTLHVEDLCSVHKFSLLCVSLCIYPPLLTSLSGDSCIIFKTQCKFLLGRIYSIRMEKFVHTKVENWVSRYAENGRFKNNTDVISFCLLCSQLFLFSRTSSSFNAKQQSI